MSWNGSPNGLAEHLLGQKMELYKEISELKKQIARSEEARKALREAIQEAFDETFVGRDADRANEALYWKCLLHAKMNVLQEALAADLETK